MTSDEAEYITISSVKAVLSRLTDATQSNSYFFFAYTYDAVGNRLAQTTLTATMVYTYDDANRLINVGGVAYRWDNNIGIGCKSKAPVIAGRGLLCGLGVM